MIRTPIRFLVLVLGLVVASGALAQAPEGQPPAPAPSAPTPAAQPQPPAQPPRPLYAIHGLVQTRGKRTPVSAASVTLVELDRTEYTEDDGAFQFKDVPEGVYKVRVTAPGHAVVVIQAAAGPGKDQPVRVYLAATSLSLGEVVVHEKRDQPNVAQETITKEEVFSLPGGGNDPVRAVADMPGVAKVNPFGAVGGLVIRGTSQGDSGYYLDGHMMPALFHFGALEYIFNSELVSEVTYLPGGYGVRYGDAIGGIVDVTSRRPRTDRIGGVANLSTYDSFALVEGPIGKKVSFAAAGRRSFIDFLFPLFLSKKQGTFTVLPSFWDYQAMLDVKANASHKIEITAFGAQDQIAAAAGPKQKEGDQVTESSAAANIMLHRQSAAWIWDPSVQAKNTLSVYNVYGYSRIQIGKDQFIDAWTTGPGLREEFERQLAKWNRLTVGAEAIVPTFHSRFNFIRPPKEGDPGPASFSDDLIYKSSFFLTTWEASGYAQDEMDAGKYVRVTPGVRFSYLGYNHTDYVDPRLFVKVTPVDHLALKVGLGQYHQFPKPDELIQGFGTPSLRPENSYQLNLGVEYEFEYAIRLEAQGFYKYLDNLVARNANPADLKRPYRNTGIGEIYGGELLARKKLTDWWFAWVSYSYTVSRRNDRPRSGEGFPKVVGGWGPGWRWFDNDVTHNFTILASFLLPKGFKVGAKWQYVTGTPYTPFVGSVFNADSDDFVPIASSHVNSRRNPDLHQLDVRLDKAWTFKEWELSLYLDIQNAYFHAQPFGFAYNYDFTKRAMVSYPAIIPSLGLTARF